MGNTIDTKKEKDDNGSKNQSSDNTNNKNNTGQAENIPDYVIMFENFDQNIDPCLNQLLLWSLTDTRLLYERFRRKTYFPLIDRNLFSYLISLSKQNSIFIFNHLTKASKAKFITIYEMMIILVLTSYSNSTDKLKMLYNIFDFHGSKTLEFLEWHAFYSSIVYGVCHLTGSQFPSKAQIEKDAKTIFIRADVAPYDQKLSFSELKEWIESNNFAVKLLFKFEPNYKIVQKFTTLLGFKPFNEDQIEEIINNILDHGSHNNNHAKVKEKIRGALKSDERDSGDKSYINNNNNNNNSLVTYEYDNITEEANDFKYPKIASKTHLQSDGNLMNSNKQISFSETKKNRQAKIAARLSIAGSLKNLSSIDLKESQIETIKLPKISKNASYSSLPPSKTQTQNEEIMQKRKVLFNMFKAKKKNIIITNGNSITRSDAEKLKSYFNSLSQGQSTITLPMFVKAFSKSITLQKVSASIFGFLDKNSHGEVTFTELIRRLYPSLTKDQLDQVLEWTHNPMYDTKFLGEESERKKKPNHVFMREVPKEAIKRMKQIYDLFDEEKKGWVSLNNLIKNFKNLFSVKEVEELFAKYDKDKDSKLSLQEFIEIILPPDYKVDPSVIDKFYKKNKGINNNSSTL